MASKGYSKLINEEDFNEQEKQKINKNLPYEEYETLSIDFIETWTLCDQQLYCVHHCMCVWGVGWGVGVNVHFMSCAAELRK